MSNDPKPALTPGELERTFTVQSGRDFLELPEVAAGRTLTFQPDGHTGADWSDWSDSSDSALTPVTVTPKGRFTEFQTRLGIFIAGGLCSTAGWFLSAWFLP